MPTTVGSRLTRSAGHIPGPRSRTLLSESIETREYLEQSEDSSFDKYHIDKATTSK